ncbi:CcoQ/FixQ family Cbb3-type cytochrome c oxidase assembly chaperone [Flavihumibacter stibioxidans]|uniref:Cytochrome C oxidase Cbb3 n=1 Tax=Flavihumibacter stibioxidans TaxID=1834163 RepID=A0ABR7M6F1_9BACT|nr:CcoQ/FixQ family Cbb3-type cytochrome c oxidase assembly chaperone [Flavihumibacter stibioxidans]MBC6490496.1 cytochrome C oxidase Cbb3 [Flavihumibacter stibioxidans]
MKFINYLESISGISIYGLGSLLIFSVFFLLVTIWAFKADKNLIDEISRIPLDKNN